MISITNETKEELLAAMDRHKAIAERLIDKIITETNQPEKERIAEGLYYEIENVELLNGKDNLSEGWHFDVHGEHCLFENKITRQKLEVSLGDKDSLANLDPYFFHIFLNSTQDLQHLALYFNRAFNDTLEFFEELEQQKILVRVYGVNFRKVI